MSPKLSEQHFTGCICCEDSGHWEHHLQSCAVCRLISYCLQSCMPLSVVILSDLHPITESSKDSETGMQNHFWPYLHQCSDHSSLMWLSDRYQEDLRKIRKDLLHHTCYCPSTSQSTITKSSLLSVLCTNRYKQNALSEIVIIINNV